MKTQIEKNGPIVDRVTRKDLLLIFLPALLWLTATYARPWVIQTRCASLPQSCTAEGVPAIDRISLGMESSPADGVSYLAQNTSATLAIALPAVWNTAGVVLKTLTPAAAWASFALEFTTVLQAITWNGLLTETSHLISQRPRPFVYSDPAIRGQDPAHYTSFYSGHTSFVAATTLVLFLLLLRRRAPLWALLLSAGAAEVLVISTAYCRIMAGRHFLTDVLVGALAGSLVAFWVVRVKRA